MNGLETRIDALLKADRRRDLLLHVGTKRPAPIPTGLSEVAIERAAAGRSLRLYAGEETPLDTAVSSDDSLVLWLWGTAFHPDFPGSSIGSWMLAKYESAQTMHYSDLQGLFVAFLFDRRSCQLHLFTDPLGLRPIYFRTHDEDLWVSSRVGTAWDCAILPTSINQEALRSWAVFGFNATDGALVDGWHRPPGATHLTISSEQVSSEKYLRFDLEPKAQSIATIYDQMFDAIGRSLSLQTNNATEVRLALSGGFDSRLLAAYGASMIRDRLRPIVVDGSDNYRDAINGQSTERWIATQLCNRLSLRLVPVELEDEPMHAYGEPFLIRQDGFPITKQIIRFTVGETECSPVMNGFLGGNLLQGAWDLVDGNAERDLTSDAVIDALLARHSQLPAHLLKKSVAASFREWAREFLISRTNAYQSERRRLIGASIWMHNRYYMSNNFLQHLHRCEPILPYATAELVQLKLLAPDGVMTRDGFRNAIARHFPAIADIPHTHDVQMPVPKFRSSAPSKRTWARQSLLALRESDSLSAFDRRRVTPRLALAAIEQSFGYVSQTTMRFLILEALADRLGLTPDWR